MSLRTTKNSRPITTESQFSVASFPDDPSASLSNTQRLEIEIAFEDMMRKSKILPLESAMEPILANIFDAENVFLWMNKLSTGFYSPSADKFLHDDSIVAAASKAQTALICTESLEQPDAQQLLFPLFLKSGSTIAVAQVVRRLNPFNDNDLKIASFLMRKFTIYGSVMFNAAQSVGFASEFAQTSSATDVVSNLDEGLMKGFGCKMTDFYCFYEDQCMKFDKTEGQFIPVNRSAAGVALCALRNGQSINVKAPRYHPNFSFTGDLLPYDPLLICVHEFQEVIVAAALRGSVMNEPFSADDVSKMEAVMPFIARSLVFATGINTKGVRKVNTFEAQLIELLNAAASFTSAQDMNDLFFAIQDNTAELVKAQKCRLMLYDQINKVFLADFNPSAKDGKFWCELTASRGFVGAVLQSGAPIVCQDPLNDERFDEFSDVGMAMEVNSIAIVPVRSQQNSIIGVLSVINKRSGGHFNESDVNAIVALSVFCGIAIQNSRLLETSLQLTKQLNDFVFINDSTTMHMNDSILSQILAKAKRESKAVRVTLFLCRRSDKSLLNYAAIGNVFEQGNKYALTAVQTKSVTTVTVTEGAEIGSPGRHTTARPSEMVSPKPQSVQTKGSENELIYLVCDMPIFDHANDVIGVLELCVPSIGSREDVHILQSFISIVAKTIEANCVDDLVHYSEEQFAMLDAMSESEATAFSCPSKFKETWPDNLFTLEFDTYSVEEPDLLGICYALFDKFGLMHEFKITGGKLFLILSRIRRKYSTTEEWRHAVESAVYMIYIMITSRLDDHLKKHEILCMIIASLCHDLDSKFFEMDALSLRADTALSVLFSKKPVFEGHQCSTAISIISSRDANLLDALDDDIITQCVDLIINLILGTDYQNHFNLMHELKTMTRSEDSSMENPKNRLLILQMLMKCADVGIITRPDSIAEPHILESCSEFFDRGPLDKVQGIVYTSTTTKTRSCIDRERSAPTVVGSVIEPMFETISKLIPGFERAFRCLQENELIWWNKEIIQKGKKHEEATEPAGNALGPDRLMEND